MDQIIHYSIKLNTFGGILEDGTKAVCLELMDKERNCIDCYPIPLDVAMDLADEIVRITKELKNL